MTPERILADLLESGITPGVTPDGKGIAVPAGRLTDQQRAAVQACKRELIAYLLESSRLTSQLISAAMVVCDMHGDGPDARKQMCQDIEGTPPNLRADLLEHLRAQARTADVVQWCRSRGGHVD